MVVLQIGNLELPAGWVIEKTDWLLANDPGFTDLVDSSIGDEANLTIKEFDIVLDPSKFYYTKCRVILNKGYTKFSNVVKFKPNNLDAVNINLDMPGIVTNPIITLPYDKTKVPVKDIAVTISGFGTTGTGVLESVNYVLTDLDGSVWFSSLENKEDKTNIVLKDVVLPYDKAFTLLVAFKSTSNDESLYSAVTFTTAPRNIGDINIITNLNTVLDTEDLTITSSLIPNLIKIEWMFYEIENGLKVSKYVTETTGVSVLIASGYLKDNTEYVIAGRAISSIGVGNWVERNFRVLDQLPVDLPYDIRT